MFAVAKARWFVGLGAAAVIGALGFGAMVVAPSPAQARVFVGVGVPFPGFWYPPAYPYYYPPPAYYYPPPPPAAYYPPPDYYPPSGPAGAAPQISYTSKPGWNDAQGHPCREYKTTQMVGGRSQEVFGTACEGPDGQWRVVN